MRKLFLSRSLEQVRLGGWIPTDRSLGAGVSDDSSIVPYLISIYVRVSSDQQADEATIEIQLADLTEPVQQDGYQLEEELCFIDDGYSGETFVRPV